MPTKPKPEITGPSSEPTPPVVTVGPVLAPVARTGLQGITANWLLDGFEVWNLVDLTDKQYGWSLVGLTVLFSLLQNWSEKVAGRRLIGAAS